MTYEKTVTLKTGVPLQVRNGCETDAQAVYENFTQTHTETDYLLSYADECGFDRESEAVFLKEKAESVCEVELIALIDAKVVGTAGIKGETPRRIRNQHIERLLGPGDRTGVDRMLYRLRPQSRLRTT